MASPALRAVKGAFPDRDITLLVNPVVAPLFEKDPHVGAIIEYADSFRTIAGRLRLARRLNDAHFATAVLLQNAFDAALIAWLARIRERIGYKRDGRGLLLTKGVAITREALRLHHTRYYLNMLDVAGIDAPYRLPWIYLTSEERQLGLEALSHLRRPVIGINPGAAFGTAKRWPAERFAKLISRIIKEKGGSAVLFGSKNDVEIAAAICGHIAPDLQEPGIFLDLTGKTGVRQLCAAIAGCDILISNDSGPMHISYAVGTPVIAIFGSTSPVLTGPPETAPNPEFSYRHSVIKKNIACSPCFKRTCGHKHLRCLMDISVDDIYSEIDTVLGQRKAVFFDRDGTLCEDANYLNSFSAFRPYEGLERLIALKDKGYMLIGISNQSGIGRGIVDEGFVQALHQRFGDKYGFDAFYYCRHVPADNCACRKPAPGMLLRARADHAIDLKNSIFVGDKNVDMETALAVGATPIFYRTDKHTLKIPGIIQINALDELHALID
ncbi:MAG: lipopolysaccharide heptosyltransferase II [Candidatus Magnetominusculus sp. LBB02]|nr:lipopolysaccharide heptosyltransferase II [Candidatus Magnetominusculus sp. LBB02]